jgi:hypothetical protein
VHRQSRAPINTAASLHLRPFLSSVSQHAIHRRYLRSFGHRHLCVRADGDHPHPGTGSLCFRGAWRRIVFCFSSDSGAIQPFNLTFASQRIFKESRSVLPVATNFIFLPSHAATRSTSSSHRLAAASPALHPCATWPQRPSLVTPARSTPSWSIRSRSAAVVSRETARSMSSRTTTLSGCVA